MEIALTGRLFGAAEAKAYGLINAVVAADELDAAVADLSAQNLGCAPLALQATKQMALRGMEEASLQDAFNRVYPALERMLAGDDAVEGPAAFVQKRPPKWTGR